MTFRTCYVALSLFILPVFLLPTSLQAAQVSERTLFANPGDILYENLLIRNTGPQEIRYSSQVTNRIAGLSAAAVANDDFLKNSHTFSLNKWMLVEPEQFSLPPGQERKILVSFKIPKDSEPGSHSALVSFQPLNLPNTDGALNQDTLFTLTISGEANRRLGLASFQPSQMRFNRGPVRLNLNLKNEGNVHVVAGGKITVFNLSHQVKTDLILEPAIIMPGSNRTLSTEWQDPPRFGFFIAEIEASYGGAQPVLGKTRFMVIPTWPLTLLALIFSLGFAWFVLRLAKKRKAPDQKPSA